MDFIVRCEQPDAYEDIDVFHTVVMLVSLYHPSLVYKSSVTTPHGQYQFTQKQTFGSGAWQLMGVGWRGRSCFVELCHFFTFPHGLGDKLTRKEENRTY